MLFEKERLGCIDYFIYLLAGERAELLDTTNPDWAPTVNLGHDKIKQNVSQLAVSRNARAQKRNENKRKYDEMASSSTSRKVVRWMLFKKKNMLSLKHLVSVHYLFLGPKMSSTLHNGISSKWRLPVNNVDAKILFSRLHSFL